MTDDSENRARGNQGGEPVSRLERLMYRSVPLWVVLLIAALGLLAAWAFGALVLSITVAFLSAF